MLRWLGEAVSPLVRAHTQHSAGLKRRILIFIHRRMMGHEPVIVLVRGTEVVCDLWDNFGASIYYRGDYEPSQSKAFLELIEEVAPTVFVDIGANFGYYSLLAVSAGVKRVLAFEPSPLVAPQLQRTIQLNPATLSPVELNPVAIADKNGTIAFWLNHYTANLGIGSIYPRSGPRNNRAVEVACARGDDVLLPLAGNRVLMKIDIEGAELKALQGMARVLDEVRPVLVVEVHPIYLRQAGETAADVVGLLLDQNYEVYHLGESGAKQVTANSAPIEAISWLVARPV
jgi:FkbM family methyltransferase